MFKFQVNRACFHAAKRVQISVGKWNKKDKGKNRTSAVKIGYLRLQRRHNYYSIIKPHILELYANFLSHRMILLNMLYQFIRHTCLADR